MKNLQTVTTEATDLIKKKYFTINDRSLTDQELHDMKQMVTKIYVQQSWLWKMIYPVELYKQIIIKNIQSMMLENKFFGMNILKDSGDTEIKIK